MLLSVFLSFHVEQLKGTGFFHESSSRNPLKITLGSFSYFLKFPEIFASQGAQPVSTTWAANLLLHGVNYTSGKFATGINDTDTCNKFWYWHCIFYCLEHL